MEAYRETCSCGAQFFTTRFYSMGEVKVWRETHVHDMAAAIERAKHAGSEKSDND